MEERRQKIDEWLDAGLKHYAAAEPREGLEGRLLATVRMEQHRTSYGSKWLIALAAIVVTAAVLLLSRRNSAESHLATTAPRSDVQASNRIPAGPPAHANRAVPKRRTRIKAARHVDGPRREQFPSPQPLNEQEEMLARYVRESHQEAVLMVRAQAELKSSEFLPGARQLPAVESLPQSQQ